MRAVILAACLLCTGSEASPLPKPVLEQKVETTTTSSTQSSNSTSRRTESRRLGSGPEELLSDTTTTVVGTKASDFSETSVSGPDGSASEARYSAQGARAVEETDIDGTDYLVSLGEGRARRKARSDSAGAGSATVELEYGAVDSRNSIDSDGLAKGGITNATLVSGNVTKCDSCLEDPDVNLSVSTIQLSKDDIDDPGLFEEVEAREPSTASAIDRPTNSTSISEPASSTVAVQRERPVPALGQPLDVPPTSEPEPPKEAEPDDDFHLSFEIKQCRNACCSVFDLRKDCICYQIKIGSGCIIHALPSANV